jgi:hypothetical protein
MQSDPSFSNIQLELLKLYASNIDESDLINIKRYLAKYFATKAISEADEIWNEKGYDNELMKKWLNEENDSSNEGSH